MSEVSHVPLLFSNATLQRPFSQIMMIFQLNLDVEKATRCTYKGVSLVSIVMPSSPYIFIVFVQFVHTEEIV